MSVDEVPLELFLQRVSENNIYTFENGQRRIVDKDVTRLIALVRVYWDSLYSLRSNENVELIRERANHLALKILE